MNRTERLSLAERLDVSNSRPMHAQGIDRKTLRSAATILRKLAELRPVAWRYSEERFGRSLLRLTHEEPEGCPRKALYQLSEVLTDE